MAPCRTLRQGPKAPQIAGQRRIATAVAEPPQLAEQLAAIASGLVALVHGAARILEAGLPTRVLVEMEGGLMLVMAISDGSSLAVLAAPECDTDLVSYEMTLLVEAVGDVLTPAVRGRFTSLARGAGENLGELAEVDVAA